MSWVVIEKSTGNAILETFDGQIVERLNTDKYQAMPALEYLQMISRKIKAENILQNNLQNT